MTMMQTRVLAAGILVAAAAILANAQGPATQPARPLPSEAAPGSASSEAVTLKIGDPAPALKAHTWVKGKEVKSFELGKVYVVEFWATWCGPCRESIPHLSQLSKSNKNVTFIGVAASERKEESGSDQRLTKLKRFVREQGDKIAYTIAYDSDRSMGTPWMKASGYKSIPTAFIVDGEGKIAWIGHPMEVNAPLAEALAKAPPVKPAKKSKDKSSSAKDKGKVPSAPPAVKPPAK